VIKFINSNLTFTELTRTQYVKTEIILQNPTKDWDLVYFAENFPITIDVILDNPNFPWPDEIAANKYITWETIVNTPNLHWSMSHFCRNPNFSLDLIKNINIVLDFQAISKNKFGL
jgi:hypothetical protein